MTHELVQSINRCLKRPFIGVMATITIAGFAAAGTVGADPADDGVAKLNELSRQAEQVSEAVNSAQLDLDAKLAAERAADDKLAADRTAAETATAQLTSYQSTVDRLAASVYMGGRTDGMSAIMTAGSPQQLIDKMSIQRKIAAQIATQMDSFRKMANEAQATRASSEKSAGEARTAAEQAARVRADVQAKQSDLQVKIAVVKSQYDGLSPDQRTAMSLPPELPPAVQALAAAPPPPPPPAALPGMMPPPPPGASDPDGARVVQAALSQAGEPYVWGGATPGSGFDCSGLVMWSFQQVGKSLPHSSQALASGGAPVAISDMQPGDVVTYYSDASHVGIYIGDGMIVHASTYGVPLGVASVNNAPIYNVRRY